MAWLASLVSQVRNQDALDCCYVHTADAMTVTDRSWVLGLCCCWDMVSSPLQLCVSRSFQSKQTPHCYVVAG
jgi:hypothetical protein